MKNNNLFSFNLTSLFLLVGCVILFVFLMNQCSNTENALKTVKDNEQSYVIMESKIIAKYNEEKQVLRDSVLYWKDLVESNLSKANAQKALIKQLKADLSDIKPEVESNPTEDNYMALNDYNRPIGLQDYSFAGNQVNDFLATRLEREKLQKISDEYKLQNEYLTLSMITCGEMADDLQSEVDACDQALSDLEVEMARIMEDNKKKKRKLWTNRSIAGVFGLVAALLLL